MKEGLDGKADGLDCMGLGGLDSIGWMAQGTMPCTI